MPGRSVKSRPGDPLTDRQAEVLAAMQDYQRQHGIPATLEALGHMLGLRNPNGVLCHVRALERKGRVHRAGGNPDGKYGRYALTSPKGHCPSCGQAVPKCSPTN